MPEWLDVKKTCFWDVMCFCFVSFFQELGNSALSFFFFKRSLPPTLATASRSGTSTGRGCGLSGTGRARLGTRRPRQTFPGPVFCFYLRTCLCVTTKMPGLFPFLPFFFFFTCNPQFRGGWHTHEAGGCSFSADGVRGRGPNSRLCLARSYVWKKDNVVLTPSSSSRAVVEKDGSLLISQTWSGDIGDYTCEVLSEGGNDSRAARLEVM